MSWMSIFLVIGAFFGPILLALSWNNLQDDHSNFPRGFLRHLSKIFGVSALVRTDTMISKAEDITLLEVDGHTLRIEAGGLVEMSRVVEVIFVDENVSADIDINMSMNKATVRLGNVVIPWEVLETLHYPYFAEIRKIIETSKQHMSAKSRARFLWRANSRGFMLRCELMPYEDNIMAMHFAKVLKLWVEQIELFRAWWVSDPAEFWLKVIDEASSNQPILAIAWPILWKHQDAMPEEVSLPELWSNAMDTLDPTVLAKIVNSLPEQAIDALESVQWSESRWLVFLDALYADLRREDELSAVCQRRAAEVIDEAMLGHLKRQYMGAFWPLWRHYWVDGNRTVLLQMSRRHASRMPLWHQLEWVYLLVLTDNITPLDWAVVQMDELNEEARQQAIRWMMRRVDEMPELLNDAEFRPWLWALVPHLDAQQSDTILALVEAHRAFEILQALLQLNDGSAMAREVARRKADLNSMLSTYQGYLSLSEEGEQGGLSLAQGEGGEVSLLEDE